MGCKKYYIIRKIFRLKLFMALINAPLAEKYQNDIISNFINKSMFSIDSTRL